MFPERNSDTIFESNSSFQVKWYNTRIVRFLFLKSFLLVLTKLPFLQGYLTLGYPSMKFIIFSDFFFFVRSEALNRSSTPEATPIYHVYK